MIGNVAAVLCLSFAVASPGTPEKVVVGPPVAARPAAAAAETARDFYAWYLSRLARDHDPIRDDRANLARWVSPALLGEIDAKMRSADGLEADPFIQAQDYLDSWLGAPAVDVLQRDDRRIVARVTMGAGGSQPHRVYVTLLHGPRGWRIRKIGSRAP